MVVVVVVVTYLLTVAEKNSMHISVCHVRSDTLTTTLISQYYHSKQFITSTMTCLHTDNITMRLSMLF